MKSYQAIATFNKEVIPVEYVLAIGDGLILFNPNSEKTDYKIQLCSMILLKDDEGKIINFEECEEHFELKNSKGEIIGNTETFDQDVSLYLTALELGMKPDKKEVN